MREGSGLVRVEYHSLYIHDINMAEGVIPERLGNGLVNASPGCAIVVTGRHTGEVAVTLQVAGEPIQSEPTGAWDDVVEISQVTVTGQVAVFNWSAEPRTDLPVLEVGPGSRFRLRAHARRREGAEPGSGVSPEEHLIQLWPEPAETV